MYQPCEPWLNVAMVDGDAPGDAPAGAGGDAPAAPAAEPAAPTNGNITHLFQDLYGDDGPKTVNQAAPRAAPAAEKPGAQVVPASADGTADGEPNAQEAPATPEVPATPPPAAAGAPDPVPAWAQPVVQSLQQQQQMNDRLATMFQQQMEAQQALYQQAAQARQAQQAAAQAQARLAAREASRPRMPDPQIATPQEMFTWAQQNASYEAQIAREDATAAFQERMTALEQNIQNQQRAYEQQRMAAQAAEYDRHLQSTVERFASDPRFPFLKDPDVQSAFLANWWSANEMLKDKGQVADPAAVLQSMVNAAKKMVAVSATSGARAAAQATDAARRDAQTKRGIQPTLGGSAGTPPSKAAEQKARELQTLEQTPWFDSGALRTG